MENNMVLLDELDDCIYVRDEDTYELLYINRMARQGLPEGGAQAMIGKKCYEAFAGREEPCESCSASFPEPEKQTCRRQERNPVNGRYYEIKDCRLEWEGRRVRMEIATDVTKTREAEIRLTQIRETEQIINECLKVLHASVRIREDIEGALAKLGAFLQCERTYIFMNSLDKTKNSYEWCAPGVAAQRENLQDVPLEEIGRWMDAFQRGENVIIEDLNAIRETAPEEYKRLQPQNIKALVAVPLKKEEKVWGFLGADNVAQERLKYSEMILELLAFFFSARLLQQQNHDIMKQLSYTDVLTGTFNRNAYIIDMESEYKHSHRTMGIVFIDVNQLKNVNDTLGHKAGDERIRKLAEEIKRIYPHDKIYRVGGDEFVVVCQGNSRVNFDGKTACMRLAVKDGVDVTASIGAAWEPFTRDVEALVEEADRDMYREKEAYRRLYREIL